jgi:uncharacterized repeat protein (TIGR03803 family)
LPRRSESAGVETTLYSFAGVDDGAAPHGSLIQASDGYLYGMTGGGGGVNGQGVVFKMTLAGAETVLYSFAGGPDGASPEGNLIQAKDGGSVWNDLRRRCERLRLRDSDQVK